LGTLALAPAWAKSADTFGIAAGPGHQGQPAIWGDWVVWCDMQSGTGLSSIRAKNLATEEELRVSSSDHASSPAIDNGVVVWMDRRDGDYDIYRFDLESRKESVLYAADGNQVDPAIQGDTVVWRNGEYPHWSEVWGYSIAEGNALLVSETVSNKWKPDVYGKVVVWGDYRNGDWDVYGYDLAESREFAIATGPEYQRSVAIFGDTVAYENSSASGGPSSIGLYDLVTGGHEYVFVPSIVDWLDIFEGTVVWGDYRGGDSARGSDIYGYSVFAEEEFIICGKIGWQYNAAIDHDMVVWSDDRNGGFGERDIYGARLSRYIHVDASASGKQTGWNWTDAYDNLQDALGAASSGDRIVAAQGTYTPDRGMHVPTGDRAAAFELVNGVAVYGGFASGGGKWSSRDPNSYETILSGDLNNNDVEVGEPCDLPGEPTRAENSYHVITSGGAKARAVLDGFTISGGNADGSDPNNKGGGMYDVNGRPTVINCRFSDNSAFGGGGMYCGSKGATVSSCTFTRNSATVGGGLLCGPNSLALVSDSNFIDNFAVRGGASHFEPNSSGEISNTLFGYNDANESGGALYLNGSNDLSFLDCNITDNRACWGGGFYCVFGRATRITGCRIGHNEASCADTGLHGTGGGVYCWATSALISGCVLADNFADTSGGAVYTGGVSYPASQIWNCLIVNNRAGRDGGGISANWDCEPTISKCTVVGNEALGSTGEIGRTGFGGGLCSYYRSNVQVRESIFWNNCAISGNEMAVVEGYLPYLLTSRLTVSYSDVEGGQAAVKVDDGCTLNWGNGNLDSDPCFVAPGHCDCNAATASGYGGWHGAGDYHLRSEAGRWDSSAYPQVDLTSDGIINLLDFGVFAESWHKSGAGLPGDLDGSGHIDAADMSILFDSYLVSYQAGLWVADIATSPCIDAGDPSSDWTDEFWPHGKRANIGAYSTTPEASMSPSSLGNIADLNNDGVVSLRDFSEFGDSWGGQGILLFEDLNRDGSVDRIDLGLFVAEWLWQE
jgi:beta propeller repeat protein